jgi:hypothetical protein
MVFFVALRVEQQLAGFMTRQLCLRNPAMTRKHQESCDNALRT